MQRIISSDNQQVFLSYDRNDEGAADALRTALECAGLTVFMDKKSIRIGDGWIQRLERALQECSSFVLLTGRNGMRGWLGAEVDVALDRHLSARNDERPFPIFPVLLEAAVPGDLRPFIARLQAIRWSPGDALPDMFITAVKDGINAAPEPEPFEGCPFRGLAAFRYEHAKLFFGRSLETLDALKRLGDQQGSDPVNLRKGRGGRYFRWLQIEGNSGTGKSSLVNAGLLPMIKQNALWVRTGYRHIRILEPMMPGKEPLSRLAEVLERGLIANPLDRDILRRLERLQCDDRIISFMLKEHFREPNDTAFLLVVDQFEELYTLAEDEQRTMFDALLAYAIQDKDCPLFVISAVRADFLHAIGKLPALSAIYNDHCNRYTLQHISETGLREAIEGPAKLAGLDVSEISTAIIDAAHNETGALPLVENALDYLWQQRRNNRLSGELYQQNGGLSGILCHQADDLLKLIDKRVPKGRRAALELLLRLTHINEDGQHTRQRTTREDAVLAAGEGDVGKGERILQLLSGGSFGDAPTGMDTGTLRLVTTDFDGATGNLDEAPEQRIGHVDLIHETLIRYRETDRQGTRIGYWPTLYRYIEKHFDRGLLQLELNRKTTRWRLAREPTQWRPDRLFRQWWSLAGVYDLWRFRRLKFGKQSDEFRYLASSRRWAIFKTCFLVFVLVLLPTVFGLLFLSAMWAGQNQLPNGYIFKQVLWRLGLERPLPELAPIEIGEFIMGCKPKRDDIGSGPCDNDDWSKIKFNESFQIGKYEIKFIEYDYFIWDQRRSGFNRVDPGSLELAHSDRAPSYFLELDYPEDESWGRDNRPVINVDWYEALAYTNWLSKKIGLRCSLPTAEQWEYAARAGTDRAYALPAEVGGSDDIADKNLANCDGCGDSYDNTSAAGSFEPNAWEVHDLHGNVWEWCQNKYIVGDDKDYRELRGGAWSNRPEDVSSGARVWFNSTYRYSDLGFRVVCSYPMTTLNTGYSDTPNN